MKRKQQRDVPLSGIEAEALLRAQERHARLGQRDGRTSSTLREAARLARKGKNVSVIFASMRECERAFALFKTAPHLTDARIGVRSMTSLRVLYEKPRVGIYFCSVDRAILFARFADVTLKDHTVTLPYEAAHVLGIDLAHEQEPE